MDNEIATYRLGGLGCTNEHSDEITQIYLKNYSAFYDFSDPEQAKKIMYELTVPEDFPAKFKEYAARQGLKNINVEKIVSDLETKASKNVKRAKDLKMSNMKKIGDKIKRYLIRN